MLERETFVSKDIKLAVVIGASAGIGRATSIRLLREGIHVIGCARRGHLLEGLEREFSQPEARFTGMQGDAARQETIDQLLRACEETPRRAADIVVINAGRGLPGSLLGSDPSLWEEVFRVNCLGAMRQMRAFGNQMIMSAKQDTAPRARDIIVLGSVVGRHVSPSNPVYGATKFAVNSLAEAFRQELGKNFIRVSLIEPGIVRTEFQETAGYDMTSFADYEKEIDPVLKAEDIAELISFIVRQPAHVHVNDIVIRPTRQVWP